MQNKEKYVIDSIRKKDDDMIYVVIINVINQEKRLLRFKPEDSYQFMLNVIKQL